MTTSEMVVHVEDVPRGISIILLRCESFLSKSTGNNHGMVTAAGHIIAYHRGTTPRIL